MHREEWGVTECHLAALSALFYMQILSEQCVNVMVAVLATEMLWKSQRMLILLNHTEQTANAGLKNISQIVSRLHLAFDLLHSIDHSRQSKSTLEFLGDERNHEPLKILTVLLMRTWNSGGWGGSWNWSEPSWKFAGWKWESLCCPSETDISSELKCSSIYHILLKYCENIVSMKTKHYRSGVVKVYDSG